MHTTQYLAVDTETTGLNPAHNDIIELAAIPLDELLRPRENVSPYHTTIKPRLSGYIDAKAIEINGHQWVYDFESEGYKNALHPTKAWNAFYDWMKQHYMDMKRIILVGWNVSFDESFLKQLYLYGTSGFENVKSNHEWPFHYHKMDLITICRFLDMCMQHERRSYALEKIATEVCEKDALERFKAHTALSDIQMSLEVYRQLVNESQIIPMQIAINMSSTIRQRMGYVKEPA